MKHLITSVGDYHFDERASELLRQYSVHEKVNPMPARVFASLIVLLSSCCCQVPTSNKTSHEALSLLRQAAKRYADAKSFAIEKIGENDARSEFSRQWLKSLTKAIQETDSRYRYEVRASDGSRAPRTQADPRRPGPALRRRSKTNVGSATPKFA
jgi:hypothetical protein